ncbi:hypothetical protein ACIQZB_13015 [Streptomyces sp. NPDC097727]|uniref:hypothetical protein n=1 Tax=Streptomyces sp. NPDC097727 TaxID=3366092 RepID=UPI00382792D0
MRETSGMAGASGTSAMNVTGRASHHRTDQAAVRSPTPIGTAFGRAVRFESRQLTSLRSTGVLASVVGLLSCANGLGIGFDGGEAVPAADSVTDALQFSPVSMQVPLIALMIFVFGAGSVTVEFSRGAARTTWLAAGSRGIAFAAKLAVGAAVGAGLALGCTLLGVTVGAVTLGVRGVGQPDWGATVPTLLCYLVVMGCWPVIAVSTAALIRNRVGTALVLVLWPLLGERLAGIALGMMPGLGGIADWLPFGAARAAMLGAEPTGEDGGFVQSLVGTDLTQGTGLLVFCVFAAVLACAGAYVYGRRDAP